MRSLVLFLVLAACAGCATTASPPYRDFRPAGPDAPQVSTSLLREAAVEAGWATADSPNPAVVSTRERQVAQGALSTTHAALDLVPLGQGFVRVYVRAERRSIFGSRGKVYALDPALRRAILRPISEALAARGLDALDAPRDRDEDATD